MNVSHLSLTAAGLNVLAMYDRFLFSNLIGVGTGGGIGGRAP